MSTPKRQEPGETCSARRVWLLEDPLVTDIEVREDRTLGRRECQSCGRPAIEVTRQPTRDSVGRWMYAGHTVPERAPRSTKAYVNPKPRLAEADFERALSECANEGEMAHRLGVNLRTVQRAFDRYRPGQRVNRGSIKTTKGDRRRIRRLAKHGTPAAWIAEEMPYRYETVLQHARTAPGYAEETKEWQRVWPSIRNNPTLLALHHEFAPTREARLGHHATEDRDRPGVRRVAAAA